MSEIYLISDPHFGHTNMALKRGFKSVEEHDEHIVECWNNTISKRDVVWVLGDVTMEKKSPYPILDRLLGTKKVILGNHDRPEDVRELLKYVNLVGSMVRLKGGLLLTHCPIHTSEIDRFVVNIHGHVHENTLPDERYINVSCEAVNYTPIKLKDLLCRIPQRS
jgi:calcineurin-like phosphoesterase family protein